jgi:hypothetical protein
MTRCSPHSLRTLQHETPLSYWSQSLVGATISLHVLPSRALLLRHTSGTLGVAAPPGSG